jgi:hypothetical protein
MDKVEISKSEKEKKPSKFKRRILYVAVSLILLVLVAYIFRLDRFGFVEIDYVDCVYMNNQFYFSHFERNAGKRTLIDPMLIEQKIGEVKFTLSENVHSTYYINRNGDASFLDIGTEIFSVKKSDSAIAIKIGEQYFEFDER